MPLVDIRRPCPPGSIHLDGKRDGSTSVREGKHVTLDLTPKKVRFIISVAISVVLTVIAIVIQYVHTTGGATHGGFEILLVGYLVLLAGSLLRGV